MKKILALVLAAIMLLCFVGCKPQDEEKIVEIEFVQWWAAEGGGDYLDELVADFEAENQNIKINLVTLPFGDTRNQTIANFATGTSADIIAMNPPWTREFYDLGILAPLDELMANDKSYNKDDYIGVSYTPIEGKTYLAPVTTQAFFLYYNKDMFDAANLELPKSFGDIRSAAKALTNPAANQYGFTMVMSEQSAANGSILSLYPLLYANNGRTLVNGKYNAETPEMVKALELLQQINADGSFLPGTTSKSENQVVEEFAQGNIGMMIEHDGHILTIENRNPNLNYGIMVIPSYDGVSKPELRHHGWDVGISSQCEHKEEAWKFISYMTKREKLESMGDKMMKVPAIKDAKVDFVNKYPNVALAIDYMNQYEMVEELMSMPKSSACWTELTKAGSQIIQGTLTPAEAVKNVQKAWNELLGQ